MPVPLTLVLVGDILIGRGVAPLLSSRQNTLWRYQPLVAGADLSLGNLESAPHCPQTGCKPYFNPGDLAMLRAFGFVGLNLANNHSLDAGEAGATTTESALEEAGIRGAGLSLGGSNPVAQWSIGGRRVAVVSATQWGPFVSGRARLTRLEVAPLQQRIRELSAQGVFVIASLHWGTEGVATMSAAQREIAHSLIDAGAVAVWGHHPHVAGSVESYKGRPIFASTGNFLWDTMRTPQSGLLVRLLIDGQTPQTAKESWRVWRVAPEVRRFPPPPTPTGEKRIGAYAGRFDKDGERVSWILWTRTARGRPILRALERTDSGWRVRATGFPRDVARVEVGDINGDGRDELVVELRQRSKLDAHIKPRLHIYDLGEGGFKPLWRGSQLSRPFHEWTLAPRADDMSTDLVALESAPDKMQWLCIYRWNGFGLRVVWQHPLPGQLRNLKSGIDTHGTYLTFDQTTREGQHVRRVKRAGGENWRLVP